MICWNHNIDRDSLVTENMGLIGFVLKKLMYRGDVKAIGWDEAFAVGAQTLVQCSRGFDPKRGFAFTTYAHRAICNDIVKAAQKEMKARLPTVELSLDPAESLGDETPFDEERLPLLLDRLRGRFRLVVEMYYGITTREPMTYKEIAADLGLSWQRVQQMHDKAVGKMRARCG
jgi:RNA polymerase primary sigma factor/RNA polymerase sigma factor